MLDKLELLHSRCLASASSFVSFRLPLESHIQSYVQYKTPVRSLQSLEEINHAAGFVFSPFDVTDQHKAYLIEPDCIFNDNAISDEWLDSLLTSSSKPQTEPAVDDENGRGCTQEFFESSVAKALHLIERGEIHKVVLSKTQVVEKPTDFSASLYFQKLCSQYPHAFVYFISIANQCSWIGASPEPLLLTNHNSMQTVSLAGTQPAMDLNIENYSWSEKELDEQAVVTQFIERALHDNGITNFRKSEVHNYQAANLIHLKSVFEFSITETKNSLSQLLAALHPTPSVGGLPRREALAFIRATEKHQRSYYTGFLGTVGLNEQVQLFVNLRCMKLLPSHIVLYSGAGITAGSIPEKEWIETENKIQTLKRVLFSSEL